MKIGIVGCGNIAQVHANVLKEMQEHSVVACVDIVREKAEKMAACFGANAYESIQAMLNSERPDVIHLCTPHYLHTPMITLAAQYGVAVFTEKPPVISHAQWYELQKASDRIPIGICFQNRYNPNIQEAMKIIHDKTYGEVLGVKGIMTWHRDLEYYSDDWHGKKALEGGGALINQAIHTLDLLIRFMGRPDEVSSSIHNHHLRNRIEVEDTCEIYMASQDRRGILYASTAFTRDEPVQIVIHLEKAVLRLEQDRITVENDGRSVTTVFPEDAILGKSYWGAGHKRCIHDFYDCLEQKKPFMNRVSECRDTIETYLKVYE